MVDDAVRVQTALLGFADACGVYDFVVSDNLYQQRGGPWKIYTLHGKNRWFLHNKADKIKEGSFKIRSSLWKIELQRPSEMLFWEVFSKGKINRDPSFKVQLQPSGITKKFSRKNLARFAESSPDKPSSDLDSYVGRRISYTRPCGREDVGWIVDRAGSNVTVAFDEWQVQEFKLPKPCL